MQPGKHQVVEDNVVDEKTKWIIENAFHMDDLPYGPRV